MIFDENVPLSSLTTLNVGGPAQYLAHITSKKDLLEAMAFSKKERISVLVLGGGSNLLVPDKGFNGLVLKIELKGISFLDGDEYILAAVGAGENWDSFVEKVVSKNLWGIENLSWIPGTVGGTPIQNVGAYGAEAADVIEWVKVYDKSQNEFRKLSNTECLFSYRSSIFKKEEGKDFIVTEVCFKLMKEGTPKTEYKEVSAHLEKHKISKPTILNMREAIIAIRRLKFPSISNVGTAGSFFKNPILSQNEFEKLKTIFPDVPNFVTKNGEIKVPLAWILEELGWKDVRQGNIGTFKNQPLVLVTYNNVTADEVISFAKAIKEDVKNKTGINISNEVTFV